MSRFLYGSFCAVAVLAAVLTGCGGGPVATPTSYKTWNATDGTFSVKYPENWKAEGGGKHGVQWAEFSSGSARIHIDVSTQSSLISDISRSTNSALGLDDPLAEVDPELEKELSPIAAAHTYYVEAFPVDLSGYKEQESVSYRCGLGDSLKSEFTARAGIASKIHGYRATSLTTNKGVHILCQCPESNWKSLQPAFDEILNSLTFGGGP